MRVELKVHHMVIRNKSKPIKMGKDDYTLCDAGEHAQGYVLNNIVHCGRYTYTSGHNIRLQNKNKLNEGDIIERTRKAACREPSRYEIGS